MKLLEALNEAEYLGSYFVTVTLLDRSKTVGNLTHHTFCSDFSLEDIVPSLDAHVRSLGITPPESVDVVKPPVIEEARRPLKIGILTVGNNFPDSYSIGRAIKDQILMLKKKGHEVVLFVLEGSGFKFDCEVRAVVPNFKREKRVVDPEGKRQVIEMLRSEITSDFDLMISQDMYIDSNMVMREAIAESGVPVEWLHFCRSGIGMPVHWPVEENHRFVYLNSSDVGLFAKKIGMPTDRCRVVPNVKDISSFFKWDPITTEIANRLDLYNKDIIGTLPFCTTRTAAKGVQSTIATFGALKKLGKNVALILCNSNAKKLQSEVDNLLEFADGWGLKDGEDILVTSTLPEEFGTSSEVPNKVVSELMQLSSVFVYATVSEVSSHTVLEAGVAGNLLVLNSDLPCLFDAVDPRFVIRHPFTSARSLHYSGRTPDDLEKLAKKIVGQLDSNWIERQRKHMISNWSMDGVYKNWLEPILYERVQK
jgi:hypothetical protein